MILLSLLVLNDHHCHCLTLLVSHGCEGIFRLYCLPRFPGAHNQLTVDTPKTALPRRQRIWCCKGPKRGPAAIPIAGARLMTEGFTSPLVLSLRVHSAFQRKATLVLKLAISLANQAICWDSPGIKEQSHCASHSVRINDNMLRIAFTALAEYSGLWRTILKQVTVIKAPPATFQSFNSWLQFRKISNLMSVESAFKGRERFAQRCSLHQKPRLILSTGTCHVGWYEKCPSSPSEEKTTKWAQKERNKQPPKMQTHQNHYWFLSQIFWAMPKATRTSSA